MLKDEAYALAEKLYEKLTRLNRTGEHWDKYDDEREIREVGNLILDLCQTAYVKGVRNQREITVEKTLTT